MKLWEYFQGRPMMVLAIAMFIVFVCSIVMAIYVWRKLEQQKNIAKAAVELNKITNSIRAGLVNFVYEDNLKITFASRGFYELLGYNQDEIKDLDKFTIYDFLDARDFHLIETMNQQKDLDTINLEIRMITKSGHNIDVLVNGNSVERRDGKHTMSAVFVDITQQKLMRELILLEGERYRVAAELSNDVLFEYHIRTDEMVYTDRYREIFGKASAIEEFYKKNYLRRDMIHPDDWGLYLEFCSELVSGNGYIQAEFRMIDRYNTFIWCHIMGKTIYDDQKRPLRVIGKIVDVDTQKRELEALEYKATRDPLTGVYNKEVTIKKIDKFLNGNKQSQHILMFIDFDDFKKVNDNYGHLLGDKVLVNVIQYIRDIFNEGEIIGRIGGDEFVVFCGDVSDMDEILLKAELLVNGLDTIQLENGLAVPVSVSIGIAAYPEDGMQYEHLIACADKAMYEAKRQGKRNYMLYEQVI